MRPDIFRWFLFHGEGKIAHRAVSIGGFRIRIGRVWTQPVLVSSVCFSSQARFLHISPQAPVFVFPSFFVTQFLSLHTKPHAMIGYLLRPLFLRGNVKDNRSFLGSLFESHLHKAKPAAFPFFPSRLFELLVSIRRLALGAAGASPAALRQHRRRSLGLAGDLRAQFWCSLWTLCFPFAGQ